MSLGKLFTEYQSKENEMKMKNFFLRFFAYSFQFLFFYRKVFFISESYSEINFSYFWGKKGERKGAEEKFRRVHEESGAEGRARGCVRGARLSRDQSRCGRLRGWRLRAVRHEGVRPTERRHCQLGTVILSSLYNIVLLSIPISFYFWHEFQLWSNLTGFMIMTSSRVTYHWKLLSFMTIFRGHTWLLLTISRCNVTTATVGTTHNAFSAARPSRYWVRRSLTVAATRRPNPRA